ncbi:hypothetical protein [Streptomyces sp. NPDC058953]|uniref:hypothetical protein n=1 Tax=unclassified Streptomyces TaxID=2593676 RepID=UPI0036C12D5D
MARVFAVLTDRHGGAHARTALVTCLVDDAACVLTAPARPALRRELLTLTAQLTHMLANMTADTGHAGLAQRYYSVALTLAGQAHDRRQYAVTLRAMSLQALTLGHPGTAHGLTSIALEIAGPDTNPAVRAFVLSQHALTHAYQRQRRPAHATLIAAEASLDRVEGGSRGPFATYPRPGLDYQRARTLATLGDWPGAPAEPHLRLGHLEMACHHWHIFLDDYPRIQSHRADRALSLLLHGVGAFPSQPDAPMSLLGSWAWPAPVDGGEIPRGGDPARYSTVCPADPSFGLLFPACSDRGRTK